MARPQADSVDHRAHLQRTLMVMLPPPAPDWRRRPDPAGIRRARRRSSRYGPAGSLRVVILASLACAYHATEPPVIPGLVPGPRSPPGSRAPARGFFFRGGCVEPSFAMANGRPAGRRDRPGPGHPASPARQDGGRLGRQASGRAIPGVPAPSSSGARVTHARGGSCRWSRSWSSWTTSSASTPARIASDCWVGTRWTSGGSRSDRSARGEHQAVTLPTSHQTPRARMASLSLSGRRCWSAPGDLLGLAAHQGDSRARDRYHVLPLEPGIVPLFAAGSSVRRLRVATSVVIR